MCVCVCEREREREREMRRRKRKKDLSTEQLVYKSAPDDIIYIQTLGK